MWEEKYERENEEALKLNSENSLQNNGRIASKNKCNVFFFRLDKCLRSLGLSIGIFLVIQKRLTRAKESNFTIGNN